MRSRICAAVGGLLRLADSQRPADWGIRWPNWACPSLWRRRHKEAPLSGPSALWDSLSSVDWLGRLSDSAAPAMSDLWVVDPLS